MLNGYDISSVQGSISAAEWQAIAASGISFIVAKCGNGNSPPDPNYAANIAGAQVAGIQVLAYHFLYPLPPKAGDPTRDPQAQAQMHFNAANGVRACADLEWPTESDWQTWGCSASQIAQWALDYLAAYSQLSGQPMIIYTYPNFAQTINMAAYPQFAQYPLWIASYDDSTPLIPAPWQSYVLWQTGGGTTAHLPSGAPVDTDVCPDPSSVWGSPAVPITAPLPLPPDPAPPIQTPPDPISVPSNPVSDPTSNIWTSIGNTISSIFGRKS